MKLSLLKHLRLKTKAIIIVILIAVLLLGGTLSVLIFTGTIKFKAATITKNVTVTGKFTDALTFAPVSGAKIIVGAGGRTPATVTTKADGSYRAVLTIYPENEYQRLITIYQNNPGYPLLDGGIFTQTITDLTSAPVSITQNINLTKLPTDPISENPLDPTSERCRTSQNNYEYTIFRQHTGDYFGLEIGGVLFCTDLASKNIFDDFPTAIRNNAAQIISLKNQTGLSVTPRVYLIDDLSWKPGYAADTDAPAGEITIKAIKLLDLSNITHEVGHLVDWYKGPTYTNSFSYKNASVSRTSCRANIYNTKWHCFASAYNDFEIAHLNIKFSDIGPNGYITRNTLETFATMFEALFTPENSYITREKTRYAIENMLLGNFEYSIGSLRATFKGMDTDPGRAYSIQNSTIYIYKSVAFYSNFPQYFPGTVGRWNPSFIADGRYMGQAVVSVKLVDHTQRRMENTSVTIAGKSLITRIKKESGVFIDGTGDLFNTTGTAVAINIPSGLSQKIDIPSLPDYYQGAKFNTMVQNLNRGATKINLYFIPVGTGGLSVKKAKPIDPYVSAKGITSEIELKSSGRTAKPILQGEMSRHPLFGSKSREVQHDGDSLIMVVGGDFTNVIFRIIGSPAQGSNTFINNLFLWPPPLGPTAGQSCFYSPSESYCS